MFSPFRSPLRLALLIAAGMAAGATQAREATQRPAAPRERRAIVETGQVFSIRSAPTAIPGPAAAGVPVRMLPLGRALNLDRRLFHAGASSVEASDAPHR